MKIYDVYGVFIEKEEEYKEGIKSGFERGVL
jgi:hypothetical protein